MAKKKETITPTTMWMGCGYKAHLMNDSTDSRLVIICPGGQEAIILPRATAEQWEADVKKTPKENVKITHRATARPPSPARLQTITETTVKPTKKGKSK